jgi:hypothetical protein
MGLDINLATGLPIYSTKRSKRRIYRKLSDTTRSNTTSQTNDPELSGIPLVAGKSYRIIGSFMWISSASGVGFESSTNALHAHSDINLVGCQGGHIGNPQLFIFPDTLTGGFGYLISASGSTASVSGYARSEAVVKISSTGNMDFRWAQKTAGAATTTLRKGSYIEVEELD